jgi:hypothetical protein
MIVFDSKPGKHIVELGEKEIYSSGKYKTESSSNKTANKKNGNLIDDQLLDDYFAQFDEDEELDDAMIAAAEKANLVAFGDDFDPSELTDEELDKIIPELKVLFDC